MSALVCFIFPRDIYSEKKQICWQIYHLMKTIYSPESRIVEHYKGDFILSNARLWRKEVLLGFLLHAHRLYIKNNGNIQFKRMNSWIWECIPKSFLFCRKFTNKFTHSDCYVCFNSAVYKSINATYDFIWSFM